jgi:hypothetical protein
MPEGDTVFLAATRMRAALAGQRLVGHFRVPRNAMQIGEKGSGWDSIQAKSVRRGATGVDRGAHGGQDLRPNIEGKRRLVLGG